MKKSFSMILGVTAVIASFWLCVVSGESLEGRSDATLQIGRTLVPYRFDRYNGGDKLP